MAIGREKKTAKIIDSFNYLKLVVLIQTSIMPVKCTSESLPCDLTDEYTILDVGSGIIVSLRSLPVSSV